MFDNKCLLESETIILLYFSFRWQTIRLQHDFKVDHSVISNVIDIKEIGKGHTSESLQRICYFFAHLTCIAVNL